MVSPQGGHHSSDASHVESQLLPKVHLHLYHMKVVVGFLITYLRQLVVVLLKYRHCRRENRSEELSFGLDTAAIDVVHLAHLLRHRLEVEVLTVAERQTSVGYEDEEVTHPGKFALELVAAHELQFKFGERFTFTALASLQRHHLIRILWNFAHLIKLANPLVDFLVVAVTRHIGTGAIMQPVVKGDDVLRSQVAIGVEFSECAHGFNGTNLVLACTFAQIFIGESFLHKVEKALSTFLRLFWLLLLYFHLRLLLFAIEVIHEIVVGSLFIKNVHRSNDFLTLCYQSLCFGRSCCCLPVVG